MTVKCAGIFAAGEGSRLEGAAGKTIKPMLMVGGKPLCHWVAENLALAGVSRITFLSNSRGVLAQESLARAFPRVAWTFLTRDTASSWESFRLVAQALADADDSFALSTVDALVPPSEVRKFLTRAVQDGAAASLALTDFVDDEKPLWADVDARGFVTALGERARQRRYATAGLYHMSADLAARLPGAGRHSSLRGFWSQAVADGVAVAGIPLAKTLDVDRPEDLAQAQEFVRGFSGRGAGAGS